MITLNELVQFAKDNPTLLSEYNGEKQLRLQVLKSAAGNLYAAVDTWKPTGNTQPALNIHNDSFSKSAPGPVDDLLPF